MLTTGVVLGLGAAARADDAGSRTDGRPFRRRAGTPRPVRSGGHDARAPRVRATAVVGARAGRPRSGDAAPFPERLVLKDSQGVICPTAVAAGQMTGVTPTDPGARVHRRPSEYAGRWSWARARRHRRRCRRGRRGRPPPRAVGGSVGTSAPQPAATISSNSRRTQSSSATTRSSQASALVASAPCVTARGTPGPAGATARIRPRSRWSPADHPWSPRSCAAWLARPPGRSTGARRRRSGPPTGPGPGCPPGRAGG